MPRQIIIGILLLSALFLPEVLAETNGFERTREAVRRQLLAEGSPANTLNPHTHTAEQLRQYLQSACLYHHKNYTNNAGKQYYREWIIFQSTGHFTFTSHSVPSTDGNHAEAGHNVVTHGTWETFFNNARQTVLILNPSDNSLAINIAYILEPGIMALESASRSKVYQRLQNNDC